MGSVLDARDLALVAELRLEWTRGSETEFI